METAAELTVSGLSELKTGILGDFQHAISNPHVKIPGNTATD
jgi:hypothetical protein